MSEDPFASFPWPIPTTEERHQLVRDALSPLPADDAARLFPVLDVLFVSVLTGSELLHCDADNPIEHHTTVLKHMMEIAKGENFAWDETRRAAAIAILHDNGQPGRSRVRSGRGLQRTQSGPGWRISTGSAAWNT